MSLGLNSWNWLTYQGLVPGDNWSSLSQQSSSSRNKVPWDYPSSHWHVSMSVVKDSWKELDLSFLKEIANFNTHILLTRGQRGKNYRYLVSPAGPSLRVTCHKACSRMCIMELAGSEQGWNRSPGRTWSTGDLGREIASEMGQAFIYYLTQHPKALESPTGDHLRLPFYIGQPKFRVLKAILPWADTKPFGVVGCVWGGI